MRRRIDLYGFRFATLLLQFPDYGNYELEATVLLDTLTSEAPALTHEQQEQLFHQIEEDYQDIPLKADRMKAIRQDQFFNARRRNGSALCVEEKELTSREVQIHTQEAEASRVLVYPKLKFYGIKPDIFRKALIFSAFFVCCKSNC